MKITSVLANGNQAVIEQIEPVFMDTSRWTIDKSTNYPNNDISFSWQNGGRVYEVLVISYTYFADTHTLMPTGAVEVEINDDDVVPGTNYHTSYFESTSYTLHYFTFGGDSHVDDRCIVAHEYSHLIADGWGLPYTNTNHFGENWANFGSCIARGTSTHDSDWCIADINVDADTFGADPLNDWALAGVMWDLNHDIVVETLRYDSPQNAQDFYNKYRVRDTTLTDDEIKTIFENHGFDTSGW